MGFFDRFKKKKTEENLIPDHITVRNLGKGYMLDYEMQTWEVRARYEYDWGGNFFSQEYQIFNGTEIRYLGVEEDDELELSICRKVKLKEIQSNDTADVRRQIIETDEAPYGIIFEGRNYKLTEKGHGYFRDIDGGEDNWAEFINWEYEDEDEEHFVTIEQWGETDIEASAGKYLEDYEVGNFLPR